MYVDLPALLRLWAWTDSEKENADNEKEGRMLRQTAIPKVGVERGDRNH